MKTNLQFDLGVANKKILSQSITLNWQPAITKSHPPVKEKPRRPQAPYQP